MRNLLGRRKDGGRFDTERLGGECLQLLAEDDGVGTASLHEFDFLRREGRAHIGEVFAAVLAQKLLRSGVDLEHRAGFDRIFLLKYRIAVIVENGLAVVVEFLDPVLEVDADTAGHAHRRQEDRRNAVGACDDRRNVDEGHIGAGLFARPQRHIVDARHA